jgi:hypothetical protein
MEWVIPSGFLRNIPRVPDRTGNELGMDQEWTRTSTRNFYVYSTIQESWSIPRIPRIP